MVNIVGEWASGYLLSYSLTGSPFYPSQTLPLLWVLSKHVSAQTSKTIIIGKINWLHASTILEGLLLSHEKTDNVNREFYFSKQRDPVVCNF